MTFFITFELLQKISFVIEAILVPTKEETNFWTHYIYHETYTLQLELEFSLKRLCFFIFCWIIGLQG